MEGTFFNVVGKKKYPMNESSELMKNCYTLDITP